MKLPSKELLSKILKETYTHIEQSFHLICVRKYNDGVLAGGNDINIYELMHKMKVWALSKGYRIDSAITDGRYGECVLSAGIGFSMYFEADTEFEAVTEACEWVLKENK